MITNPTPQRALRSPRHPRPADRAAAGAEHHAALARRLTARDMWLIRMLHEHRVLTSIQIAELAFPRLWAANKRLLRLYQWRVVDRFQPHALAGTGTAPMHYVLDVAGAHVLAHEGGISVAELGYRRDRAVGIAYSLTLAHAVTVNGFFTALAAASRQPEPAGTLTAWWSERRCARYYGGIARPDAYGRWRTSAGGELEFFLELDWGTEPPGDMTGKLTSYHRLAETTAITTPVLFVFPHRARETAARATLQRAHRTLATPAAVPVATASFDIDPPEYHYDPDAARWLTLHGSGRCGFTDLARTWPRHSRHSLAAVSSTAAAATPGPVPACPLPLPPPGSAQPWRDTL
ncbi:replication-relaxation family protein [Haloechinothrix salitolerans]|uniref:Replication-relaxation family protein n=1 Tax=Haloechinothrix salitolerans TaxID=926830 RepID=A0ABW2C7C9_9PSEU